MQPRGGTPACMVPSPSCPLGRLLLVTLFQVPWVSGTLVTLMLWLHVSSLAAGIFLSLRMYGLEMGSRHFFYLLVLNNIFPGWRTDCLRSAADASGTCVYSLQGSQEVGRKVILLQTSTIRRMSPARRTLRIWTDLCREWSLRRLLLLLPQGVITAAIKNERIKTDTGQWQGPSLLRCPYSPAQSSHDHCCEGALLG